MTKDKTDFEWFLEWKGHEGEFTMEQFAEFHGLSLSSMKNKIYRGSKEAEEELTVEGNENQKDTVSKSETIRNLEDLRAATGFSEEEWAADNVDVKTYQGYRKDVDKDLEFDEGRITGHVRDVGKMNKVTMYTVRATFTRREPTAIKAVPPRLEISFNYPKPDAKPLVELDRLTRMTYHKSLLIFDAQIALYRNMRENSYVPIHDRRAMDAVWQVARKGGYDNIVLAGDWMDFPEQSTHFTKEPRFSYTTEPSIIEQAWWISRLRMWNEDAAIEYLEGNHEERLARHMLENAPMNYGLRNPFRLDEPAAWSVPSLLGLADMGVRYHPKYPNNELWLEDDLLVIHGNLARAKTGTLNKLHEQYPNVSVLSGHTHRAQEMRTSIDTRHGTKPLVRGISGCLCRLDQVVPGHNRNSEWTQGFYEVFHSPAEHHVIYHPINKGRLVYNGELIVGQDRYEEISQFAEELGWTL